MMIKITRGILSVTLMMLLSACSISAPSKPKHVVGLELLPYHPVMNTDKDYFSKEINLGKSYTNNKLEYSIVKLSYDVEHPDEFRITKRRDRPVDNTYVTIARSIYTYKSTQEGMKLIDHRASQSSLIGSFSIPILTKREAYSILKASSVLN